MSSSFNNSGNGTSASKAGFNTAHGAVLHTPECGHGHGPGDEACPTSGALAKAAQARSASEVLGLAPDAQRRQAILCAAAQIEARGASILAANAQDMRRAQDNNMSAPLQDRLLLTSERLHSIAQAMRDIAGQADPLGRLVCGRTLDSGVRMEQITVPLGVVAMIYEARPNVTADAFALCMRAGNACVLRGGSAAQASCCALSEACRAGVLEAGLPEACITWIEAAGEEGRAQTRELMHAHGLVDVLIPRGGAALIRECVEHASVPVIETGTGNCHIYLHEAADPDMALSIVLNAKTQRPGVCNAAESLLVDHSAAQSLLPPVLTALAKHHVVLCGDKNCQDIARASGVSMDLATEEDWGTEYLDLKMSVKMVADVREAIAHINRYGTGHSEAIVTRDYNVAETFLAGVNAAAVYVNASTRFTDGGVFGLGGEIGISTQKLHARGPMGADVLTTTKYLLRGNGQIRG